MMLLLCFFASSSYAQNIKGTIKSQSGESVAFANISVLNGQQGSVADKEGNFTLNLKEGTYQLQFSAIGFATQLQKVVVADELVTIDIVLSENTQTLGEVVVTANKREEDILNVPTAITSLSAKKIEDTRTWGLEGLNGIVPNYTYLESGVSFQQIQSIRGIQVFSEVPAVSTYVDDVNNVDILANGFVLTDIERIEVLRGPQGTLFGRNAMGGVVNIYTKKPTNKTKGFVESSFGNLGLQRYTAAIKTPLVKDQLFFGLSGLYQTKDGFLRNSIEGTASTDESLNGREVGGEENLYGNMFLKWLPSDQFSFTLNLKGQKDWSDNSGFFVAQYDRDTALENPDVINLTKIGEHERRILNSSLVAKYYANNFTITSISAYQTIRLGYKDIDSYGIYSSFVDDEIGEVLPPQKMYSQEFRINSKTGKKLNYTAGIYGFANTGYRPASNYAYDYLGSYSVAKNKAQDKSLAAFGEVSYLLTQDFEVTAGLRYDYEEREATFGSGTYDGTTLLLDEATKKENYTSLSPKVALKYQVTDKSNVYASYTRGFRAGGINSTVYADEYSEYQTFDPEYSNNFELGYKGGFLNNTLRLSAAAFYIKWKELQFYNLVAPNTYSTINVGDASSAGLEVEIAAIPVKGLQLDGSFGVNFTEYKDFDLERVDFTTFEEISTPIDGNKLSNAPSSTLFIGAQYDYAINKDWKLMLRGEVRNTGKFYTDIQNEIEQPNYTLLNARFGISYGMYNLYLWAQNISNERYLAFGNPDSSVGRGVRTATPRTYGLTLNVNF